MAKAIALFSGGLDSTLAILQMMKYGVEVEAITFLTHFGCDATDSSSCGSDPYPAAKKFGFPVKLCHLGEKFVEIVKNPRFGHGKNLNPCIDCRLIMLKEAHEYMKMSGGDFIITGEVAGQRPMSQRRFALDLITRECGLDNRLVRPLSGRLLPPTLPEQNGLIMRDWLLDIEGRSRKRQMALAKEFGLTEYPNPAGGCLLTDEGYSNKLRDMLKSHPDIDFNDLNLLRAGRYFRLGPQSLLVVGRNEAENNTLESLYRAGDIKLEAPDFKSPIGLLRGSSDNNILDMAASIVARYSDGNNESKIKIIFEGSSGKGQLETSPANQSLLNSVRI